MLVAALHASIDQVPQRLLGLKSVLSNQNYTEPLTGQDSPGRSNVWRSYSAPCKNYIMTPGATKPEPRELF